MNKKNRSYEKTENAIKEALIKLSHQRKSLSDIKVKELCELANISRSTFYLHYADIESVFDAVGDKFILTFNELITDLIQKKTTDFSILIKEVFNFISESNELIKVGLTLGNSLSYYIDGIKSKLEALVMTSPILDNSKVDKSQLLIEIKIISAGIIDLIIDLLKNNSNYNADTYTRYINNYLNRWVSTLNL